MKIIILLNLILFFSCANRDSITKSSAEQIEMTLSSNENNEFKTEVKNLSITNMKIHMGPPSYVMKLTDGREYKLSKHVNGQVTYIINKLAIGNSVIFELDLKKKNTLQCWDLVQDEFDPISLDGAMIYSTKRLVNPKTWKFFNNQSMAIPFPKGFFIGDKGFVYKLKSK